MIVNTAKATEAATVLGVELETLNPETLGKAYRVKARDHHPDSADNYDPAKWAQVQWAKNTLLDWLEQKLASPILNREQSKGDCRSCGGSGRVVVGKPRSFGAKPATMMCVMCNGTGCQPEGGEKGTTER